MRIKFIVMADGETTMLAQNGTPNDAKARLASLIKELGIDLNITGVAEPEQHRHDAQGQGVKVTENA